MGTSPQFVVTPHVEGVKLNSTTPGQNTARDGSGSAYSLIFTATGSIGSRVNDIRVIAAGTVAANTACKVLIWWEKNGTSIKRLIQEITIAALTPSASAIGGNNTATSAISNGYILPVGDKLYASCTVLDLLGNQYDVVVQGGDF